VPFEQTLLLQAIVSGVLMGGIYILISVGLTMIYGVMDLVNFAHGSFLMLGMYSAFWLFSLWSVSPYLSLLLVPILFFGIGWVMEKALIHRVLESGYMLGQFIITFGLWLVIENSAVIFWHLDPRSLHRGAFQTLFVGGVIITYPMALAFCIALGLSIAFHMFMTKSWTGLALSATAQNRASAEIVGMNVRDMYALAMAIGIAMVSVAGVLLATFFPMTPYVGLYFLIIAFVVAVLGGLGNYVGAMFGGLILGLIEGFFGFFVAPEFKQLAYLFVFISILALRPQGLLGRKEIRGG
jgi:branched-chain amino acid transport system permease protein